MVWFAWLLLLLGFAGPSASADGKVFPPTAYLVEVTMPDQRALLWWSNGVERLVIETRFKGEGTNFAWVVPLPSAPKVEAATRGLFPTLTHLLRPRIIHSPTLYLAGVLIVGSLIWLNLTVRPGTPTEWRDWVACVAFSVGFGLCSQNFAFGVVLGLVAMAFIVWGTIRVREEEGRWAVVMTLFAVLVMLSGMFLPALSSAGAYPDPQVNVLDRQRVGVFETTTITGSDPKALRGWLNDNGYALPKEAEPVIADYLRDEWVFVASKVRKDVSSVEVESLPPLSFTFAAREPVYPLRLTGVGNRQLEVDLFVFGPERASAAGFRLRDCRRPLYPTDLQRGEGRLSPPWDRLAMAHEGLRNSAPGSAYVTRLQGRLSSAQMRQDAVIRWVGQEEVYDTRYSARGALLTVANWSGSALCLFFVVVAILARARGMEWDRFKTATMVALGVALLGTGIGYASLEVVPVVVEKRSTRRSEASRQQMAVRFAVADELNTNGPVTLETVRAAIRRQLPAALTNRVRPPPRVLIREEDSPYNYSLRETKGGVELLLHDDYGNMQVVPLPEK